MVFLPWQQDADDEGGSDGDDVDEENEDDEEAGEDEAEEEEEEEKKPSKMKVKSYLGHVRRMRFAQQTCKPIGQLFRSNPEHTGPCG